MSLTTTFIDFLNTSRDGDYHFSGQPIPKLHHTLHEEILLTIQSKLKTFILLDETKLVLKEG